MTDTTAHTALEAGTWTLDPTHATIGFVARHMVFTKVRGTFTDYTATIEVPADGDLTQAVASATIQTASVNTGNDDRDTHLKSPDFFDVEQYPTIEFRSTDITMNDANHFSVTGDLTIKAVTKPITLTVEYGGVTASPWNTDVAGVSAHAEVDRRDWGLEWNMALDKGGVLVSEKITLELDFEAGKQG
ncbi:MAG: YceI family protein [Acidimicrobiia bacterium]